MELEPGRQPGQRAAAANGSIEQWSAHDHLNCHQQPGKIIQCIHLYLDWRNPELYLSTAGEKELGYWAGFEADLTDIEGLGHPAKGGSVPTL